VPHGTKVVVVHLNKQLLIQAAQVLLRDDPGFDSIEL
jgi:hypothetical protein